MEPMAEVLQWLAAEVAEPLRRLDPVIRDGVEEIRLRAARPVQLVTFAGDHFLPVMASAAAVDKTWQIVCEASVYSREEEARHGFLTLPGGHRVGIAGRVLAEGQTVRRVRDVTALNFRLAREKRGCADGIMPRLWDATAGGPYPTLILSLPGGGKTTLLRDVVRQLSAGAAGGDMRGQRVVLIDERGEIAAAHDGVPRLDVGPRTDVLDRCPKAAGIQMALRSLNPQVIAFDELGGPADAQAVLEAAHAGVKVVATAHARSVDEFFARPSVHCLRDAAVFQRFVILERHRRPGRIKYVGPA